VTPERGGKRLRQEEGAIAALLSEPTIEAAARKARVGERTLLRWMAEPEFKAQYRAARRSVVEGAIGRLQQAATQAVDSLTKNLTCGIPAVEVGAAKAVLDQAIKAVELVDLAERVEALEHTFVQAAERAKDVLSQPFQRWDSEIVVMRGCWGGETEGSRTLAHGSLGW
jgi:hypothetical protein